MKNLVCVLSLVCALGCTTAVVRPYVGEQPVWPMAGGSVINTRYQLPIFTTLPSAPYTVIAELRIESPFYATPEPGQMPVLIKKAKQLGADAIALVEPNSFFKASTTAGQKTTGKPATGGTTVANSFLPEAFKGNVSVVAIRWVSEPPHGLPAKYAKTPGSRAVEPVNTSTSVAVEPAVSTKPAENTKTAVKVNFGPLRPAAEQKRDLPATTETPAAPVQPGTDPRQAPQP